MSKGRDVVAAYNNLLDAVAELASTVGFEEQYVLHKTLPITGPQNDSGHILGWMTKEKQNILDTMMRGKAERRKKKKRSELITQLGLTRQQLDLLGVEVVK